ncbi:MAG: acarbose 7IV-phosphotransferase [Mycobacteriales bacterium]
MPRQIGGRRQGPGVAEVGDGRRRNFYDGKWHLVPRPDPQVCRRVLAGAGLALFHLPNWARGLLPVARGITESVRRAQITARYTCGQRADSSRLITTGQLDSTPRAPASSRAPPGRPTTAASRQVTSLPVPTA